MSIKKKKGTNKTSFKSWWLWALTQVSFQPNMGLDNPSPWRQAGQWVNQHEMGEALNFLWWILPALFFEWLKDIRTFLFIYKRSRFSGNWVCWVFILPLEILPATKEPMRPALLPSYQQSWQPLAPAKNKPRLRQASLIHLATTSRKGLKTFLPGLPLPLPACYLNHQDLDFFSRVPYYACTWAYCSGEKNQGKQRKAAAWQAMQNRDTSRYRKKIRYRDWNTATPQGGKPE